MKKKYIIVIIFLLASTILILNKDKLLIHLKTNQLIKLGDSGKGDAEKIYSNNTEFIYTQCINGKTEIIARRVYSELKHNIKEYNVFSVDHTKYSIDGKSARVDFLISPEYAGWIELKKTAFFKWEITKFYFNDTTIYENYFK